MPNTLAYAIKQYISVHISNNISEYNIDSEFVYVISRYNYMS